MKGVKQLKGPVTTLRLAYYGCPNRPFFHIVATKKRIARNRGYYEQVGTYDPMANDRGEKLVALNMDRIKYWLSQGAGVTNPVLRLFGLAGIFPLNSRTLNAAERNRKRLENKDEEDKVSIEDGEVI